MKINKYKFYCSSCSKFVDVYSQKQRVIVILDLEKDSYIFKFTCPECGKYTKNSRGAF